MVENCTYIDGIGSSVAIDTAGEIVDLSGIDCSSLIGGQFNYEHKSDIPAQVCGKILEYKKIFSEQDCENDRHKHYWEKCKNPFLYVMGRLFDDKKDSAKEVAALFQDDAEHPDEHPMIGFSVEGSKIDKKGIIVTKSIARKITLTGAPANKQCIAEMVPAKGQKNEKESLFKAEPSFEISLAKAEVPGSKYPPKEKNPTMKPMETAGPPKFGPISKAEVPGSKYKPSQVAKTPSQSLSFAPGWSHSGDGNFSHPEHGTVSVGKQSNGEFHVKHNGGFAGAGGKKGIFGSASEAGAHAGEYMRGISTGKIVPKSPHMASPSMNKAMSAGSGLGAPSTLSGGAALAKEDLLSSTVAGDRIRRAKGYKERGDKLSHQIAVEGAKDAHKDKLASIKAAPKPNLGKAEPLEKAKIDEGKSDHQKAFDRADRNNRTSTTTVTRQPSKVGKFFGKKPETSSDTRHGLAGSRMGTAYSPGYKAGGSDPSVSVGKKVVGTPAKSMRKTEDLLKRAQEAYEKWSKREEFESYMAKTMPELTKGEIKAIGQTLALSKSVKAEKALSKMMAGDNISSYIQKSKK